MLANDVYKLIHALMSDSASFNSEKCAELLKISSSTFKKELSFLNRDLKKQGVQIVGKSGKGNGYHLEINDQETFQNYFNEILPKQIIKERETLDYSVQENRVSYLAHILLQSEEWIKSSEFIESMYVSKNQLTNDLNIVRNLLSQFEIKLVHKPHYGLKAVGEEYNIRLCLASILNQNISLNDLTDIKTKDKESNLNVLDLIAKIIVTKCSDFGYELSSMILDSLVVHLYIAYKRVLNNQILQLKEDYKEEIRQDNAFALATSIVIQMQSELNIQFYDDEVYYVTIHLSSKRTAGDDISHANKESMSLVDKMIKKIFQQYSIDFSANLDFKLMLALHVTPLLQRVKYHINLQNPLLFEIKEHFIVPYELAVCCASIINEEYACSLTEDEIGYFALHIKVALGQVSNVRKKDVLLVCSTGRGSAQLLKYQFMEQYKDSINRVECCDVLEIELKDLSNYDAIFTTVPLGKVGENIQVPVFLIDSLGFDTNRNEIKKFLDSFDPDNLEMIKYFPRELFFGIVDAENKEELIEQLCNRIGKVYNLPADFKELVMHREKLANTNFGSEVAFPHPSKVVTSVTFISVALLKHPIDWGSGKVKLVLLSSFEKGFVKNNQDVFKVISSMISDKKYVDMLMLDPTYETLVKIIRMTY